MDNLFAKFPIIKQSSCIILGFVLIYAGIFKGVIKQNLHLHWTLPNLEGLSAILWGLILCVFGIFAIIAPFTMW